VLQVNDNEILFYLTPGQRLLYAEYRQKGQRQGQAFMNSIDKDSYIRLTGSILDPFYRDDLLPAAIELLAS
jgi:hypothetical protein